MDVIKKDGYLECNYTNGCKYKADRGYIYRKEWETGKVFKAPLREDLEEKVENFTVNDPFNNGPAWSFLHSVWKETKDWIKKFDDEDKYYFGTLARCKGSEFE